MKEEHHMYIYSADTENDFFCSLNHIHKHINYQMYDVQAANGSNSIVEITYLLKAVLICRIN